jgi:putative transcriptional regulator
MPCKYWCKGYLTFCKDHFTHVATAECAAGSPDMRTVHQSVKTHLRRLRFEHGELSQADLAERVSVTRQTIIAIERGDYSPSVKLALLIARTLGTTVEQVFELEKSDDA